MEKNLDAIYASLSPGKELEILVNHPQTPEALKDIREGGIYCDRVEGFEEHEVYIAQILYFKIMDFRLNFNRGEEYALSVGQLMDYFTSHSSLTAFNLLYEYLGKDFAEMYFEEMQGLFNDNTIFQRFLNALKGMDDIDELIPFIDARPGTKIFKKYLIFGYLARIFLQEVPERTKELTMHSILARLEFEISEYAHMQPDALEPPFINWQAILSYQFKMQKVADRLNLPPSANVYSVYIVAYQSKRYLEKTELPRAKPSGLGKVIVQTSKQAQERKLPQLTKEEQQRIKTISKDYSEPTFDQIPPPFRAIWLEAALAYYILAPALNLARLDEPDQSFLVRIAHKLFSIASEIIHPVAKEDANEIWGYFLGVESKDPNKIEAAKRQFEKEAQNITIKTIRLCRSLCESPESPVRNVSADKTRTKGSGPLLSKLVGRPSSPWPRVVLRPPCLLTILKEVHTPTAVAEILKGKIVFDFAEIGFLLKTLAKTDLMQNNQPAPWLFDLMDIFRQQGITIVSLDLTHLKRPDFNFLQLSVVVKGQIYEIRLYIGEESSDHIRRTHYLSKHYHELFIFRLIKCILELGQSPLYSSSQQIQTKRARTTTHYEIKETQTHHLEMVSREILRTMGYSQSTAPSQQTWQRHVLELLKVLQIRQFFSALNLEILDSNEKKEFIRQLSQHYSQLEIFLGLVQATLDALVADRVRPRQANKPKQTIDSIVNATDNTLAKLIIEGVLDRVNLATFEDYALTTILQMWIDGTMSIGAIAQILNSDMLLAEVYPYLDKYTYSFPDIYPYPPVR